MDERAIKRLLFTLVMAVVAIMIAKYLLVKAATNVGQAADRTRAIAVQPATATTWEPAALPLETSSDIPGAASASLPAEPATP